MEITTSSSDNVLINGNAGIDDSAFFKGPKGAFVIIDFIVSFVAIALNMVLFHVSNLVRFDLRSYQIFFNNLLLTNIFISVIYVSALVWQLLPGANQNICIGNIFRSLQLAGFFVAMFNLGGMSVDHFIGVVSYRFHTPKTRTNSIVPI